MTRFACTSVSTLVLGICGAGWGGLDGSAQADVFHYKDGRVLSGKVISSKGEDFTVEIAPGCYVKILAAELERNGHEPLSEPEAKYAATVVDLPDTVEQHLRLASQCKEKGMLDLEEAHYRRVLDLEPENKVALARLDYQPDRNKRWVKKEEIYGEDRGKVFYKGRWRFPESVALEQLEEQANEKIAPLKKDLSRWHSLASFGRTTPQKIKNDAIEKIQQIQDPLAVGILAEYLLDTRKPAPVPMRLLYARVISRFQNYGAAQALATASVVDPEVTVRNACLDGLRGFGRDVAVPTYIGYLGDPRNEIVNRAADGLAQFSPPEAVLPLINAVVTEHVVVSGGGNSMNVGNGGTFGIGGGAKSETVAFNNNSVLAALTQLTGQSFGYDENRWIAWYASVQAAPARDLRRD